MDLLCSHHLEHCSNSGSVFYPRNIRPGNDELESRAVRVLLSCTTNSSLDNLAFGSAGDLFPGDLLRFYRIRLLISYKLIFLLNLCSIRAETGDDRYHSPFEKKDRSLLETMKLSVIRPFCKLLKLPFAHMWTLI